MKERFSIGETAKLMGISSQTLRYYSNEGLLEPDYIDKKTGYRYYSFNQLHFIDRIKYLRSLQIPLSDIKTALKERRRINSNNMETARETNIAVVVSNSIGGSNRCTYFEKMINRNNGNTGRIA